jgi:hypothetical protein
MRTEATSVNNIPSVATHKSTDQLLLLYYDDGIYVWRRIDFADIGNFTIIKEDVTRFEYTYADLSLGIDNVPVEGEVNEPISSNWAYNHSNDQEAHWSGEEIQDEVGNILDDGSFGNVTFVYDDDNDRIYANAIVKDYTESFTGADLTNRSKNVNHGLGVKYVLTVLEQGGRRISDSNYAVNFTDTLNAQITLQVPYNDSTQFNLRMV